MEQIRSVGRLLTSAGRRLTTPAQPPLKYNEPFSLSYADVCVARAMLKALTLPTELVLIILDNAGYWPSRTLVAGVEDRCVATARSGMARSAKICFETPVLDRAFLESFAEESVKVKEIEFQFMSHDQGWTSQGTEGTFQTSSWLEVSILRRVKPSAGPVLREDEDWPWGAYRDHDFHDSQQLLQKLDPERWCLVRRPDHVGGYPQGDEDIYAWPLQNNRVNYVPKSPLTIVWSTLEGRFAGDEGTGTGEEFLDSLQDGDIVLMWARAKWPGWKCIVYDIRMTVRYGF